MPPKTRARATKSSKENIGVVEKSKPKNNKGTKPRKALADKTNSASDDNECAPVVVPKKAPKKNVSKEVEAEIDATGRPRREKRLPKRFVENKVLINLSNSQELGTPKSIVNKNTPKSANNESKTSNSSANNNKTANKSDASLLSPFKTPQKVADNSLMAPRPKRVCRLPSKFDDHSVSPNKFIPVGCHASTPILPNKAKPESKVIPKSTSQNPNSKSNAKPTSQKVAQQTKVANKKSPQKNRVVKASDTNNNAKQRPLKARAVYQQSKSPVKAKSPVKKTAGQKQLQKSFSFRVLEDKKKSVKRDSSHLDVYEFTYDPNEEPPPQKKKRKKAVKKPPKPKTVVFKNNYDQNVNKALAALKNVVSKNTQIQTQKIKAVTVAKGPQIASKPQITVPNTPKQAEKQNVTEINHMSVGIEDIAADIEPVNNHHDINYSPVTTPNHGKSPASLSTTWDQRIARPLAYNDPLNQQEDFSFFDEPPVASSSMNMSVRRPHASPWRVQFEQLPIKWQVNTYVKANMTPAVESSFINFDDSKRKKHVYTNMVPEATEELPEIVESNQPNLKQTSIISFIKDVVQRSASKKKRARSVTPVKANSLFEDISNISHINKDAGYRTPRKTPRREASESSTPQKSAEKNESNISKSSNDKENSDEGKKKKSLTPGKCNKDKDGTFFGFDESEDQENLSPVKINNPRVRALRPRARAVLQEINAQTGPSRAKIPAKTKVAASSDAVNQVYEKMKSAADAPAFPDKNVENVGATDVAEMDNPELDNDDDSQSVHLFEDIELVHHLKPTRKSYGKAKKVTFRQTSTSDSETQDGRNDHAYEPESEEDDLADLTFTMPNMEPKVKAKKKAKSKKKELSKKEKAELEAWAAGFNSMCEDIEEFPLMVE